jgi:hypothetical protein
MAPGKGKGKVQVDVQLGHLAYLTYLAVPPTSMASGSKNKGKGKAQPDVQLGHLACTLKNFAIEFEWPGRTDNMTIIANGSPSSKPFRKSLADVAPEKKTEVMRRTFIFTPEELAKEPGVGETKVLLRRIRKDFLSSLAHLCMCSQSTTWMLPRWIFLFESSSKSKFIRLLLAAPNADRISRIVTEASCSSHGGGGKTFFTYLFNEKTPSKGRTGIIGISRPADDRVLTLPQKYAGHSVPGGTEVLKPNDEEEASGT